MKSKIRWAVMVVAGAMVFTTGCGKEGPKSLSGQRPGQAVGGPCEYERTDATARVIQIDTSESGTTVQSGLYVMHFRLKGPDGKWGERVWRHELSPRCVEKQKIEVGSVLRAERLDIKTGACVPTAFEFPELRAEECK